MYKIQGRSRTIDINNNNDIRNMNPQRRLSNTMHSSFSGNFSSRNVTKRIFDRKNINENSKINLKENTFYKNNRFPPVYFYRKVQSPYKYNILSVPEYLVKTNEERHFVEKLRQFIKNEDDKKKMNVLLKNKRSERKTKDRYKPEVLDVQNILRYRPLLFTNSYKYEKNSKSLVMKESASAGNIINYNSNVTTKKNNGINNDILFSDENGAKDGVADQNGGAESPNGEEKKEKEKKDEISKEDQMKYKYHLSDILNLRKEKVITDKSAEKYLFKNNDKDPNGDNNIFCTTTKSQSDWIPNRTMGTKMNSFSSVSYNILSPLYKGMNKFVTATELNKNNLFNESTAFHRVKSISEFIDLTRVSAANSLKYFNKNKKNKIPNFKFKGSVATNQLDEYYINRDIIEKPI